MKEGMGAWGRAGSPSSAGWSDATPRRRCGAAGPLRGSPGTLWEHAVRPHVRTSVHSVPMSEQLGVGIIGLGWVAGEHVKAYQKDPATRVVAVAGRDPAKTVGRARELGLEARVHDDWEALLRDPDVQLVSICTPHALHARQAMAAAQAGKHVLVEEPIALTLDEL